MSISFRGKHPKLRPGHRPVSTRWRGIGTSTSQPRRASQGSCRSAVCDGLRVSFQCSSIRRPPPDRLVALKSTTRFYPGT